MWLSGGGKGDISAESGDARILRFKLKLHMAEEYILMGISAESVYG